MSHTSVRIPAAALSTLLLACSSDLFHGTDWASRCTRDPSAAGCGGSGPGSGTGAGGSPQGGAGGGGGDGEGASVAWSQALGDTAEQAGSSVRVDPSGDVVVLGRFAGALDLPGIHVASAGALDVFLARFARDGTPRWVKGYGDAADQYGTALAIDAAGNTVITGYFEGTLDFGGTSPLVSSGGQDVFVAKLDPAGEQIYAAGFGDAVSQRANSVALDAAGNAYVVGTYSGSITFGTVVLKSAGAADVFVAELDPNGAVVWAQSFGGVLDQHATSVAITPAGQVVVGGYYQGTIDFGGGALPASYTIGIFAVELSAAGEHVWSKGFGAPTSVTDVLAAVDKKGEVVLAGGFGGKLALESELVSQGGTDVFLAKLDPMGAVLWSKSFGDAVEQRVNGIAVDAGDRIVMTGSVEGTTDFGGVPLTAAGGGDLFLARFASTGAHLYSARFGDAKEQVGAGVAPVGADDVAITGAFDGSLDLGPTHLESGLNASGAHDVFVAQFRP